MFLTERLETCLNRGSPSTIKDKNLLETALFLNFNALLASKCPQANRAWGESSEESAFDSPKPQTPNSEPLVVAGNPVLNRLLPRPKPGLYMIRCDVNDKRYYGESTNVSMRLNSHRSVLKQGIHHCHPLQEDWDCYGEAKFDFVPLYMGPLWNIRANRIQKETFLIETDRSLCYNQYTGLGRSGKDNGFFGKTHKATSKEAIGGPQRGVPKDLLGRSIRLDDKIYPSLAEASRVTGHARKTIRAWLNDPNNSRCTDQN